MSQLTPAEALRRVKLGCSVLCVGVPQGTTFGVDATLWTVAGAAHTGVKMVPAGLHLLVHSVGHGFHAGQFVELTPSTVLVRSWDPALEDFRADGFASSGMSEAEHARYVHGVRNFDFDRQLGAYSDENANAWLRLASCINVAVLAQCGLRAGDWIEPAAAETVAPDAAAAASVVTSSDATAEFGARRAAASAGRRSGSPRFTQLTLDADAIASVLESGAVTLTTYHFDGTTRLRWLLRHRFAGDWRRLIGELQLAFVLFMYLHSLPAFEQWKALVALLCSCEAAFSHPGLVAPDSSEGGGAELFRAAVTALKRQLELVPIDFMDTSDTLAHGNFIGHALGNLFELALDDEVRDANPRFFRSVGKLKGFAQRHFQVRFTIGADGNHVVVAGSSSSGDGQTFSGGGGGGERGGAGGVAEIDIYGEAPRPPRGMEVEELVDTGVESTVELAVGGSGAVGAAAAAAAEPESGSSMSEALRRDIETTRALDRTPIGGPAVSGEPLTRMAWMLPPAAS